MAPNIAPPVILLTDPSGLVLGESSGAALALGVAIGRRCAEVVAATGENGVAICSESCVHGDARESLRVRANGKPWRMTCAEAGDQRVVMLESLVEGGGGWVTPRELEVLALIAQGLTNLRIARRLGVSRFTVRTHVEHLLDRLHVRTRTAAVARALQLGILPG